MDTADSGASSLSRRGLLAGATAAPLAMARGGATASGLPARTNRSAATRRQDDGRITFALSADDLAKVQPLLDDYVRANDVIIETQVFPYASLYEKLNINLTQATGAYDVVSMDDPWIPLFAGGQFLKNLEELLATRGQTPDPDFVPELLALGDFPSGTGLRGIPWIGAVQVFAYRTDVLEEVGLTAPVTWDDVLANAEAITAGKGDEDLYGIGVRGQPTNPSATSFLPILRGYGTDLFASNELFEPQLETDAAAQAMATLLALARLAPPGVEQVGHEENGRNMYTGRTAQSGDIWPDQLLQMFDPDLSSVVGNVAVGPEPAQPGVTPATMTGNWLLGIPEGSRRPEAALDFILWMTEGEQQKRLLLDNNIPATRISVLEDPEAVERLPFLPGLLAAGRNAVPRPRTELYPAVEEILGRHVSQAITGQLTGDEALSMANQEIRDLMVLEGLLS
jgi:multiple sugar transport system substrate-binding protein